MPLRPPRVLKHSGTRPSWPCSAHPNVDMSPCSVRKAMWSLPEGIGRGRGREGGRRGEEEVREEERNRGREGDVTAHEKNTSGGARQAI